MGCELGNLCWFFWLEIWLLGICEKWNIHPVEVTSRANCLCYNVNGTCGGFA